MGAAAVGTTLSAYALARLMMNIPSGIIGDTRGRKPLMVWGPAITALGAPPSREHVPATVEGRQFLYSKSIISVLASYLRRLRFTALYHGIITH